MISREEAIEKLKDMRDEAQGWNDTLFTVSGKLANSFEVDVQTFNMAIEALSAERPKGRWVKASEEKPNSTRHIIYADGGLISHYGYYLQPKNKWYTNWKCEEEIPEPVMWREMPEVPKESILDECGC